MKKKVYTLKGLSTLCEHVLNGLGSLNPTPDQRKKLADIYSKTEELQLGLEALEAQERMAQRATIRASLGIDERPPGDSHPPDLTQKGVEKPQPAKSKERTESKNGD